MAVLNAVRAGLSDLKSILFAAVTVSPCVVDAEGDVRKEGQLAGCLIRMSVSRSSSMGRARVIGLEGRRGIPRFLLDVIAV